MAQTLGGSGIKSGTTHDRLAEPASEYAPPTGDSPADKTRVVFIPWQVGTPQAEEWKSKSEQWNLHKGDKQFEIVYYEKGAKSDALMRASTDPNGVVYVRGHGGPGATGLLTKMGEKYETLPMPDVCERLQAMGLGKNFEGSVKFHSCYSGTIYTDKIYGEKQVTAAQAAQRFDSVIVPAKQALLNTPLVVDAHKVKTHRAKLIGQQNQITRMEALKQKTSTLRQGTTSLAKQGADHMRSNGFENCRYYGYLGPVEHAYGAVDVSSSKPEDWHKHVNLEGLQSPTFTLPNGTVLNRVRASVARVRIR